MTATSKKILDAENEDANAAPPGAIRPGRNAVRQPRLLRRTLPGSPTAIRRSPGTSDPHPVETTVKPVYRVPLLTRGSCNAFGQTTGIAGEKYPLNLIWIMPAQGSVRISPPSF